MNCLRRATWLVLALPLIVLAAVAACRSRAAMTADGRDTGSPGSSAYDAENTDIARVLAGMPPLRAHAFPALIGVPEWRDWEAESRRGWEAAWTDRLQPSRAWADAELKGVAPGCRTLLHPFGGTDFLSAYMLFPSCEGYVLVGSEPVGQLPSIDSVEPSRFASLTDDVRAAFPDVFGAVRGAGSRSGAPRLYGAIPSLLVQLARLDARVLSASRFDITTEGRPLESIPIRGGNARPAALSLTFEVPNGRPQSLVYFPADLDDGAMQRRPGAWTFLRLQAPFATLIGPQPARPAARFSLLRDLIRRQSQVVLQAQPAWTPLGSPDWKVTELPALPSPLASRRSPVLAVRQAPLGAAGGSR